MYRITSRQRKALIGCQRIFLRNSNGNRGTLGHNLFAGSNKFVLSRHYASGSRSFARRVASRLFWTTGVLIISGGTVIMAYSHVKGKAFAWIEDLYPENMMKGISNGAGHLSEWVKSWSSGSQPKSNSSENQGSSTAASQGPDTEKAFHDLKQREDKWRKKILELQERIVELENENRELQLNKEMGGAIRKRRGKKSLIEMYTDILNLLTEFDAKSSQKAGKIVDQLPKVVVVGDQSAGKTSVLEMVANARIFPRGAGEMMTRSPVMVTLSEGERQIARFSDSSREYDLTKDGELKELRSEIEGRMRASVRGGLTVSSEPISIRVYGPQLKRVVLVDLPGIISTVTTGMAADTRESIIRMCKQYMRNPNAIIMCIQDGSVDAERSIVTDLVSQVDPEGQRTIFVLTKVDLAERQGIKQERIKAILEGKLFPMKALGYYAVVTGRGNKNESIDTIQKYEREYFATSRVFQSGMLMDGQLSTRNMVNAVNEEFWKMVKGSIDEQTVVFSGIKYNLEAEWRNRFPGERVLDRNDLFEVAKADILDEIAGLAYHKKIEPAEWESLLTKELWKEVAPYVLDDVLLNARQRESAVEFNTEVDIRLRKWADSLSLANLCIKVGRDTMFNVLADKLESTKNGRYHLLTKDLRDFVIQSIKEQHGWQDGNVEQLKYVQVTTLEDKDIRTQAEWDSALKFMHDSLSTQIEKARRDLEDLKGPASFYDRWLKWQSQSSTQAVHQQIADELAKAVQAEPTHTYQLSSDEVVTIQRVLKHKGVTCTLEDVQHVWKHVYRGHFLQETMQVVNKCQRGFLLRQYDSKHACPEVVLFWRVQQLMRRCAHTLRVQLLDHEVRQLELEVKTMLDAITADNEQKQQLLQGEVIDKAERLKQVRLIQEKLGQFREALRQQHR
ncbi:dynamin-like GTPase OPA1, mitochondrial [Dysidea avara]|uniref:dynamin-like GTPase OPA1, mitochondrial n=1 Tax=Dysidea avara TaxID=196820 RepID=UPI00332F97D9